MSRNIENVLEPDDRYRNWVYNHPVAGGAFAAFVATQIATIWGYFAIGIGLPSLPFPNYNGVLFAPASVAADFSNFGNVGSFFVGQSIHFVNGIVFGLWFALVVYNQIPTFFPKMKSIQKGLLFGDRADDHQHRLPVPVRVRAKVRLRPLQLRRQRVRQQPRSLEAAICGPALAPPVGRNSRVSLRPEEARGRSGLSPNAGS